MSDPLWYKDAVIYQTHVKSYFDSNDDGIGDFAGLTQQLDYIRELGVSAIWLLPFYPSPLRDDGYDIADYKAINPKYGSMRDFKHFVREAHKRDLRVITELVINHTSDQHPWFQRAREAKKGSAYRDFYVWSDTDDRYQGTRIIFTDTETSNWAWDPVAKQYYWHRFFSHQPDLNFDNPRVLDAVLKVMRYWLDMGVDGLRLDAIPYLCEREGTNNENLPETHEIIRKIRAELDRAYPDKMLLGEANQWPEDTYPYFGDGDECHMNFHFPVMPRLYMALAQEDRHPITDILRQTPAIPPSCQWAVFLRNHDELTLEMVTDRERDYLWRFYAEDPRMRINVGIRRRLAPLLGNDRRRIELLNAILMSLPGTPIVYYGDELGMGDNIYLGDRDGVRTPMQWSADRNGGFSRADPNRLYLPPVMNPVYGYTAVNVEAQARHDASLLNWTRRLIRMRQTTQAFGRGLIGFLYPGNRSVLAYVRTHGEDVVLCVFNLSRSAQAAELNMADWKGRVPVDMGGKSRFPPIGDLPYLLTLPGHGFYWLRLTEDADAPEWHWSQADAQPELTTMVIPQGWDSVWRGDELTSEVLPAWLVRQRWFAADDASGTEVALRAPLTGGDGEWQLAVVDAGAGDDARRYFVPLALAWEDDDADRLLALRPCTLSRVRRGPRVGALHDAMADERFVREVLRAMRDGRTVAATDGAVVFEATGAFEADLVDVDKVERLGVEQSNTSVRIGQRAMLKGYRRLQPGAQPEVEIGRFLTERGFDHTPPLLGVVEHRPAGDGEPTALAVLFGYVANQGDGWTWTLSYLDRHLEQALIRDAGADDHPHAGYQAMAQTLGYRTGELHATFAAGTGEGFAPAPITADDVAGWRADARGMAESALDALAARLTSAPEEHAELARRLLDRRGDVLAWLDRAATGVASGVKTRCHGDYHLGQVLVVEDDFSIVDFEGEPKRTLAERRALRSPLRDVAGMLRSFDYAAWSAYRDAVDRRLHHAEALRREVETWCKEAGQAFIAGYLAAVQDSGVWPDDGAAQLLDLFTLEKAFYEIGYELEYRPAWVGIPLNGVQRLLASLGVLDVGQA